MRQWFVRPAALTLLLLVLIDGAAVRADVAPVPQQTAPMSEGRTAADDAAAPFQPLKLVTTPESVYAPTATQREGMGVNEGGVNVALVIRAMTDHVYRGVDHSEVGGHEDSPNLQFDGSLSFDFGKFPHPFIGVFTNIYNSDPVSRFQEIRPYFGVEQTVRPLTFAVGSTSYIYPERDPANTSEVWVKLTLDDSYFLYTERPLLRPYVLAAYDYDLNNAWYFEAGVQHDLPIEDTGITLSFVSDVGYNQGVRQQFVFTNTKSYGFQYFDIGLIGRYSLNSALDLSRRYGQWDIQGWLYYTGGLNQQMAHVNELWGGVGIGFRY